MVDELLAAGVDPCGEHGEYHTVVVDGPLFSSPLPITIGQRICQDGCWAVDVELAHGAQLKDAFDAARR
jgi:diphthamide synthase (EF-2-diphthine--ammonia ligase)